MRNSSSEPSTLHSALRAATADAHARLESCIALLEPPLQPARFCTVLKGFWGFHNIWEPLLAEHEALAVLMTGRSRLAHLAHDLAALGMTPAEIEALPLCFEARRLGGSYSRMLGSVYVMEGSTLGGQVIGKALRSATWVPEGGLRYFNPYGPRTGAMWRNFCVALDAVSASAAQEVISGARDSFALLRDWLETTLSG